MNGVLTKYFSKLFIQQWILGITRDNIKDIIRNKLFNPDILWKEEKSADKLYADPFLYKTKEGKYNIFFEDYSYTDGYGKISVTTVDDHLNIEEHKVLLDTKSHLSYPFIFSENNIVYVFPEASQSGKVACYEYDPEKRELTFLKDIINLPLLDSTIIEKNNKYWLFATLSGADAHNKLHVFYSDSLLGPYKAHTKNPVRTGLRGSRPAGNIFEVDGVLYRPAQNSVYTYGDSITINKINVLNEADFVEEFYMTISINKKNRYNKGIHNIHTINFSDDVMVVDGTKWRFSPVAKLKQFILKLKSR